MPKTCKSIAFLLILTQSAWAANLIEHVPKPLDLDFKADSNLTTPAYLNENSLAPKPLDLPEIGDSSGNLFTPLQEQELGAAFFRSLHGQIEVSKDPEVMDYIQALGQKLAANSDNPTQPFHFFVVKDLGINAFAGPGGYIGINLGLILVSEGESELASVLSHEIAHVTQRHLYQAIQASSKIQLLSMAAMLAAILAGSRMSSGTSYQNQPYCTGRNEGCRYSENAGTGLAMAAMGAGTQAMINFTRDNEAEADNIGMQTLSRSQFDPRSMPTFFERMQQSTRFMGHGAPEYLLTHPVTVSRIADTRGRAEKFPYRQYPDGLTYQLIRAKLRVQSARTSREAVDYFTQIAKQGTKQQQDVSRYGLALALIADKQAEEGKLLLQQLIAAYPNQSHFPNALAKAEMEQNNYTKAMEIFTAAREHFPENSAIRSNYIEALLLTRKFELARRLLEENIHGVVSPETYEMLGQAYSGLGNEAESHRYLAEAYYADGQTRTAILHLGLARKYAANNFYINAVIDERLRKFTEEEKERKKQRSLF